MAARRIESPKPLKDRLAENLSGYLKDELAVEIGGFEADFLLDFSIETVGPHLYDQGLRDAQALFRDRVEAIAEAIYELEAR